ncbi:transposase [Deinococcus pimensis]|uniref:transposase n=1 Tax=Deinococcus pimensis TaxID=309888 RepID=UPI0009FF3B97
MLSEGQFADGTYLLSVLDVIRVPRVGVGWLRKHALILRVDRAYGARKYRTQLKRRGRRCVCPEREDARQRRLALGSMGGRAPVCDRELYAGRSVIERLAGRLKNFHAIATRYEKRGRHFYAVVLVAYVLLWLPRRRDKARASSRSACACPSS